MTAPEPGTPPDVVALIAALDRRLTSVEMDHFVLFEQVRRVQHQAATLAEVMDDVEARLADLAERVAAAAPAGAAPVAAMPAAAEDGPGADLPGLADVLQERQIQLDQQDDLTNEPTVPPSPPPAATTAGSASAGSRRGRQKPAVVWPDVAVLHGWVEDQVALLVRKATTTGEGGGARWCRSWWEHTEAVLRFTALYLVHGELSGSGEPTWLSVYLRDHLDPHLAVLTSPVGPFHACSPRKHSTATDPLGQNDLAAVPSP